MSNPSPIQVTLIGDQTPTLEVTPAADGTISIPLDVPPGLYQLSVVMDARDYDWGLLYETLDKYHNRGRLTGPWDFSINYGTVPVVPAYHVSLGGERLGLWYAARVSLDDLERRRFRGRMALLLDGPTELTLEPLRPMTVRWQSAVVEPDPEDVIAPLPAGIGGAQAPAARWAEEDLWASLRAALEGTHSLYREPIRLACAWATSSDVGIRGILALIAAWRLEGRPEALEQALAAVDATVALPAFGTPSPDAYGHNGDMGAMVQLLGLAWAYHALRDELGPERRAAVCDKLRVQGEIFLHQALLMRDYWGGSIVQDHGWKSIFGFGAAALHMLGEIPEAERWVGWVIPRLRRSLAAMPRDGVIPGSSHYDLFAYTDEVTHYRDALLAFTGEDIFDGPQFHPIVDFLVEVYDPATGKVQTGGYDSVSFFGGNLFLNRMAARHHDGRAAWLQAELLSPRDRDFTHAVHPYAAHLGTIYGLLSYDPTVAPTDPHPLPARIAHFADSGLASYHNAETGVALTVKCGPLVAWSAEPQLTCPCDLLGDVPGAGHFSLLLNGVPLLMTPEGGYRLKTFLRSVLLIDDQGQYGDIGYPMSIPSWRHPGHRIEITRFDESTGRGLIRLDLQPAYDTALGLLVYTREFVVGPERRLIVRDRVVCDRPRTLSWLFHTRRDRELCLEGLTAHMGTGPTLTIEPAAGPELTASVQETQIVWSYSSRNHFMPFEHVRYDTTTPGESAVAQFVIAW